MTIPRNQVFNQDVLEVLKTLPDKSLDMVYGDPDYNVGISYAGRNYTTKWNDYISWYGELARECLRVLKDLMLRSELLKMLERSFCYFRKGRFQATSQSGA